MLTLGRGGCRDDSLLFFYGRSAAARMPSCTAVGGTLLSAKMTLCDNLSLGAAVLTDKMAHRAYWHYVCPFIGVGGQSDKVPRAHE